MPFSKIDVIYRSLLLTKYFVKGWGNPEVLKRLLRFRKIISKRGECYKFVPDYYPVNVTKDTVLNNMRILEGYFISPFDMYFPDLLPTETKKAHFQLILPLQWKSNSYKPVCLHMAGTGDHYFWRRRQLMAKPLLYEGGVASIILENPFYGLRKPSIQVRSILHNVTDIFVMGGCLMMEAIVLFHWCQRNGLGPLGVTGISMGGHMASLAAASWPFPIVLVPCLSWSTASPVFTQGVMSKAINWDLLRKQIENMHSYELQLETQDELSLHDYSRFSEITNSKHLLQPHSQSQFIRNLTLTEGATVLKQNTRRLILNRLFDRRKHSSLENLAAINYLNKLLALTERIYRTGSRNSQRYEEAFNFMKIIMDDCTHLSNYPVPVDTSLIICVCALNDGYVPREGVADLSNIWPGIEIRYLQGGHISAFLFHQKAFRSAIIEAFQRYQKKYL